MDLSKAKVIKTVHGQRFLLTATRLYQPYSSRGRNARKPYRWVSLASVKAALRNRTSVVCHNPGWVDRFVVTTNPPHYFGELPVLAIGCKKFSGADEAAIRKAARL